MIDLLSDTVTRPSAAMRAAIASAEVGDDQFGEDPTVQVLQERVAGLLGKEAALWLPTGTMANQVALRTLTKPGDDVIVSRESHAVWHETGAGAANSGVQFTEIGTGGIFSDAEFRAVIKPLQHLIYPPTTLVQIENTHNRAGGVIFPQTEAARITQTARERGIATFVDGARLWNAAIAEACTVADLARPFDVVSVAFSKGLGAPGGSALAGTADFVRAATRYRRMAGGAMRQVGIFAAAALYALDHNYDRLAEDHENARRIAERVAASEHVVLDLDTVRTNILVFHLSEAGPDAPVVVEAAKQAGVRVYAFGPKTIRAVTHLDVTTAECEKAGEILLQAIEQTARAAR